MGGSCYSCLRTYGNQFNWDLLRRNLVANWLRPVLVNRAAIELAG
jgi:hypothetical protein